MTFSIGDKVALNTSNEFNLQYFRTNFFGIDPYGVYTVTSVGGAEGCLTLDCKPREQICTARFHMVVAFSLPEDLFTL